MSPLVCTVLQIETEVGYPHHNMRPPYFGPGKDLRWGHISSPTQTRSGSSDWVDGNRNSKEVYGIRKSI